MQKEKLAVFETGESTESKKASMQGDQTVQKTSFVEKKKERWEKMRRKRKDKGSSREF